MSLLKELQAAVDMEVLNTTKKKRKYTFNPDIADMCNIKGEHFRSKADAAKRFNVTPATIGKWCRNPRKRDCFVVQKGSHS